MYYLCEYTSEGVYSGWSDPQALPQAPKSLANKRSQCECDPWRLACFTHQWLLCVPCEYWWREEGVFVYSNADHCHWDGNCIVHCSFEVSFVTSLWDNTGILIQSALCLAHTHTHMHTISFSHTHSPPASVLWKNTFLKIFLKYGNYSKNETTINVGSGFK